MQNARETFNILGIKKNHKNRQESLETKLLQEQWNILFKNNRLLRYASLNDHNNLQWNNSGLVTGKKKEIELSFKEAHEWIEYKRLYTMIK